MLAIPDRERLCYHGLGLMNVESDPILPSEYELLPELRKYMLKIMHRYNGIGIAAPQVGIFKQFYLMATDTGNIVDFVNPEVVQLFGHEREGFEACLSLPPSGNGCPVARCERIRIEFATTADPETRTIKEFTGMDAIVSQHELDHLVGTFFVDRVSEGRRREVLKSYRAWKLNKVATGK